MQVTVEQIDQLLPQTQCQQCGYPRCLDYASAIVDGKALINRCPPGGETSRTGLANLLGTGLLPLDPECGTETPRQLFSIDEPRCIGCTLCIQACPVDAIVGCGKKMHTVIAAECTGCGLCLPVCPVDCILQAAHPRAKYDNETWTGFSDEEVARARRRINHRQRRLAKLEGQSRKVMKKPDTDSIRDEIAAAVARVKKKKQPS